MTDALEQALAHGSLLAFGIAFVAGILTSLTPCVYPMIPITVSIFGASEARSRLSALALSLTYVMGIAVMYATLAVVFAASGRMAGTLLSNPWFVIPLFVFFVAMALSMFGLWEMRLPGWLQGRLSQVGGKGYLGAFAMGLVGGILIAPCTGPVLAGLLAFVATAGNTLYGGALLFTYALGIGVLFIFIAAFSMALPKSGAWMVTVKIILGSMLLTGGLYYLQNVVVHLSRYTSSDLRFAAVNGAAVVVGLVLIWIRRPLLGRFPLVALRALGVVLFVGASFGVVNYLFTPPLTLPWVHDEKVALAQASHTRRPVFVDFWATWCGPCKLLERNLLSHPEVRRELQSFVILKMDVSQDTDENAARRAKYRASQLPQLIVLDPRGNELGRAGKDPTVQEFLDLLKQARRKVRVTETAQP